MLLTKKQIADLAEKLNKTIDIPFVPEYMESAIFGYALEAIFEKLDEVLPPPLKQLLEEIKPGDVLSSGNSWGFIKRLVH